jgi:hypothetical protein
LQFGAFRVRRPDHDKHPCSLALGDVENRRQRPQPEIGAQGQRVAAVRAVPPEIGLTISAGRRADVAGFCIDNDQRAQLAEHGTIDRIKKETALALVEASQPPVIARAHARQVRSAFHEECRAQHLAYRDHAA